MDIDFENRIRCDQNVNLCVVYDTMMCYDWRTLFYTDALKNNENLLIEGGVGVDDKTFKTSIRNYVATNTKVNYENQMSENVYNNTSQISNLQKKIFDMISLKDINNSPILDNNLLNCIYSFLQTTFYPKLDIESKVTINVLYNFEIDNLLCDHSRHKLECYIPGDRFYNKHYENIGNRKMLIKKTYNFINKHYLKDLPNACPCMIIYLFFVKNNQNLFDVMVRNNYTSIGNIESLCGQMINASNNSAGDSSSNISWTNMSSILKSNTTNESNSSFVNMLITTINYSKFNGYNFIFTYNIDKNEKIKYTIAHYIRLCNEIEQLEDNISKIVTSKISKKKKNTNKFSKVSGIVLFDKHAFGNIDENLYEYIVFKKNYKACKHKNIIRKKVMKRADDEAEDEQIYCIDCEKIIK